MTAPTENGQSTSPPSFDLQWSPADLQFDQHPDSRFLYRRLEEVLLEEGSAPGGELTLDVACGTGGLVVGVRVQGGGAIAGYGWAFWSIKALEADQIRKFQDPDYVFDRAIPFLGAQGYDEAGRLTPDYRGVLLILGTLVASVMSSTMFLGEAGFAYAGQAGPYIIFPQYATVGYVFGALFSADICAEAGRPRSPPFSASDSIARVSRPLPGSRSFSPSAVICWRLPRVPASC